MVRIIPMAASSSLQLASFRPLSHSSFNPCCSPNATAAARLGGIVSLSASHLSGPSRRLALFHLGSIPQAQVFGTKTPRLLKAERNSMDIRTPGSMAQTSTAAGQEDSLDWVKKDRRRLLHVVYRVGDLDRTIKFYTECLGMKLLRKRDIPEERYTNAFLGFGPEDSHFVVELTYNYGIDKYDIGTGFGHFGIAVEDV